MDFVNNLDTDMSLAILSCLDDPTDLVRASAVSRSWREFVIKYSLSKNLCVKLFPQLTSVDRIIESSNDVNEVSSEAGSSSLMDARLLEREHRVYALLAKGCTSSPVRSCIADAIIASSTDNFPAESILNTLDERDKIGGTPSYWSSTGQHKTSVPETLLYQLKSDLCVITEFSIQPFQAYFQRGTPIYSSHYVRFRLGHLDNKPQDKKDESEKIQPVEKKYVWTYTSQEFPMAQENRLQTYKLPETVLCIGGYMLVEFLGRVQTQEMDGLYYICVSHVKVMGRSLAKSFRVVDPDDSGKFGLKVLSYSDPQEIGEDEAEAGQSPFRPMRNLEQLLNFLHRHPLDVEYVWPESDDEDDESDEEEVVWTTFLFPTPYKPVLASLSHSVHGEDDEASDSSFSQCLDSVERTKQKLMQTIQRFENLANISPFNLDDWVSTDEEARMDGGRETYIEYDGKSCDTMDRETEDEESDHEVEEKAAQLWDRVKERHAIWIHEEHLIMDYFRDELMQMTNSLHETYRDGHFEEQLVGEAKGWLQGQSVSALECGTGEQRRHACAREIERLDWNEKRMMEERDEVALQIEDGLFCMLMDESLTELCQC